MQGNMSAVVSKFEDRVAQSLRYCWDANDSRENTWQKPGGAGMGASVAYDRWPHVEHERTTRRTTGDSLHLFPALEQPEAPGQASTRESAGGATDLIRKHKVATCARRTGRGAAVHPTDTGAEPAAHTIPNPMVPSSPTAACRSTRRSSSL